jgi:hypothetical protein
MADMTKPHCLIRVGDRGAPAFQFGFVGWRNGFVGPA